MLQASTKIFIARSLSGVSVVLAGGAIASAVVDGPSILAGALSLGMVATAGTIHKASKVAPAVFLIDCCMLLLALGLHLVLD